MSVASEISSTNFVLNKKSKGFELDLEPLQGMWTEQQYLKMSDYSRQLLEFTDGIIEEVDIPTDKHQSIMLFLYDLLRSYLRLRGGKVLVAPLCVRIREGKYREPDIVVLLNAQDQRRQNQLWLGADLVMEIVSPDDSERDLIMKRGDYAEAAIPEYWIVNPINETISVLTMIDDHYVEHGVFKRDTQASSVLLDSFTIDVSTAFDAE